MTFPVEVGNTHLWWFAPFNVFIDNWRDRQLYSKYSTAFAMCDWESYFDLILNKTFHFFFI